MFTDTERCQDTLISEKSQAENQYVQYSIVLLKKYTHWPRKPEEVCTKIFSLGTVVANDSHIFLYIFLYCVYFLKIVLNI